MRRKWLQWTATLAVVLGLPGICPAEDVIWRAVAPQAPPPPAPKAQGPVATLGRPVALRSAGELAPVAHQTLARGAAGLVVRAQAPDLAGPPPPPPPMVSLTAEALAPSTAPSANVAFASPLAPAAPPVVPVSSLGTPHVVAQGGPPDSVPPPGSAPFPAYDPSAPVDRPIGASMWDKFAGWFNGGARSDCTHRGKFQSDPAFAFLASPVTNPFYFEDPRATELRPIFIYQSTPSSNPIFHGGNAYFLGTQARLAVTEDLSFVVNEFGLISLQPKDPMDGVERNTGLSELKLGPKWTFLRKTCDTSATIAATGLTFEIPWGSNKVSQDTGSLGLDPYVTLAQHWRLPAGFGAVNLMGELGYSFGVDNKRTEFVHASFHADYNIANSNFYPLIEFNYFHYTYGGKARDLGFEGADLVNFGSSSVGDSDELNMAFGLRYKFNERLQLGGAVEFPLLSHQHSLNDFRITLDVILRY